MLQASLLPCRNDQFAVLWFSQLSQAQNLELMRKYIILCNFGGRRMSGFEALEGDLRGPLFWGLMRPGSNDANLMQISKNQKFNVLGYIPNTWNTILQLSRQIYKYQKGICIGSRHVRNADMNLTRKWEKLLKIIERVIFILVLNVQSLRQMYWNFIRDCMSILHWTDHELRLIADPPILSKTAKESVFFSKSVKKSVKRSVYAREAREHHTRVGRVKRDKKTDLLCVFHIMSSFRQGSSKMSSSCQKSVHSPALFVNLIHSVIGVEGE